MHGQLPFDVKGMDDAVPIIDFSPDRVADPPYPLERADVDGSVFHSGPATFYLVDNSPAAYTQV